MENHGIPPHCIAAETRVCDCGFKVEDDAECPVYGLPGYVCLMACDMNRLPAESDDSAQT